MIACTGVEKHRHEEEIDQTTSKLLFIAASRSPLLKQISNTRFPADLEVLPATVGWNGVKLVWAIVTLVNRVSFV